MRVFLSYRREFSGPFVDRLKERLERDHDIACFVDRDDIVKGAEFPDALAQAIDDSQLVVAVMSPRWVTGRGLADDWCYRELLYARRTAGSNPWRKPIVPVLLDRAEPPAAAALPPELDFVPELNAVRVDPDSREAFEIDKIAFYLREVDRTMAVKLAPNQPLSGRLIGLSASLPNPSELMPGAAIEPILYFVQVLVSRLLHAGADIAFAGLPTSTAYSPTNITHRLREAASMFAALTSRDRVVNFLHPDISRAADRTNDGFTHRPTARRTNLPAGSDAALVNACALHDMRVVTAESCDARVCVGGKATGYVGRLPGVLEEASIALARSQPVYILGGFGGISAAMVQALNGQPTPWLTLSGQVAEWVTPEPPLTGPTSADYIELYDGLGSTPCAVNYATIRAQFASGWSTLGNGLSTTDNLALAALVDPERAAELVIAALGQRPPRPTLDEGPPSERRRL